MSKLKITIIGGGSYSWTDGLYSTLLDNDFFGKETELCLYDVVEENTNNVYAFIKMYNDMYPDKAITITRTTNEDDALYGAKYVLVAMSHGFMEGELEDHYIARRHGFYNVKGSESGIAGASRTIRHVPEFIRIARKMNQLCAPGARMLNVTNPLTALARCVQKYEGIESIGFCHGIMNHLEILLPFFGAKGFDEMSFSVSGVDHCSFLTDVKFKGQDALEILRNQGVIEAAWKGFVNEDMVVDDYYAGKENQRIRFILWDMLGVMPGLSDEHCAEFWYQTSGTQANRDLFGMHYDRVADRPKSAARLKQRILDALAAPEPPTLRISDEKMGRAIEALEGGRPLYEVCNYRNFGQVRELPMDTVVETWVNMDATGVHPAIANPLPKAVIPVVTGTAMREEMFMEAAVEWDEKKLVAALCQDPLVQDFTKVKDVAHEIMEYNKKWLPKGWI